MAGPEKKAKTEKQMFVDSGVTDDEITIETVDGKRLFASKGFLVYCSPVFEKMLSSDFKENQTSTINVQENYSDFLLFLRSLQPREDHDIMTDCTVFAITKLAHMHKCEALLKQCRKKLKRMIIARTTSSCWDVEDDLINILVIADRYELSDVINKWTERVPESKELQSNDYRDDSKFIKISSEEGTFLVVPHYLSDIRLAPDEMFARSVLCVLHDSYDETGSSLRSRDIIMPFGLRPQLPAIAYPASGCAYTENSVPIYC